ncbi:hypothetical protein EYF80_007221 [Liparis tanakae]|uniref:Uncharacterized protein n=1 Tax=Liparis tanakae TaxID=230148 RepID=A0A4Z2IWX9_9TELE|nr:hypothetical protein EYF80_007221 [Liparis tanakae]
MGWVLTLEVQTKFPVATETLLDASLPGCCGSKQEAPAIGPKGQGSCCQLGQHFTAEHHSPNKQRCGPRATGNVEPVITGRARLVHAPKNPSQARGVNGYCT